MSSSPDSEAKLIARLAKAVGGAQNARGLVLGIGDDAAILRPDGREDWVVTQDAQVENVHFRRDWSSPADIGHRLAAVNLSDVASMGASPRFALVSAFVSNSEPSADIVKVERAAARLLDKYRALIVGGNVSRTDGPVTFDMTIIGSCTRGQAWQRTARPGDAILVVGDLGGAAAGLGLLQAGETGGRLIRKYLRPVPQLTATSYLRLGRVPVRGAIDVSDGFSTDLLHLCGAAGVGCEVNLERLPLSSGLARAAAQLERDPVDFALHGGEDYALILAMSPEDAEIAASGLVRKGHLATVVGRFTSEPNQYRLLTSGDSRPLRPHGWDHRQT